MKIVEQRRKRRTWTQASALMAARAYTSRTELYRQSGLYQALVRFQLISSVLNLIERKPSVRHKKWTTDAILEEAKKYHTKVELRRLDSGLYWAINKYKLRDRAFFHMKKLRRTWTDQELIEECQQHSTRKDLRDHNPTVDNLVRTRGLENLAFSHMTRLARIPGSPKDEAYWNARRRWHRLWQANKREIDLNFKLALSLRQRLRHAIKGGFKSGSAVQDLGCTIEFLKQHLESKFQLGMTWTNWGRSGWHIDHIRPLSSFDLTNHRQLKQACHYTNLQPLWAKDNIKKSDSF